jgi:hypothetical protein
LHLDVNQEKSRLSGPRADLCHQIWFTTASSRNVGEELLVHETTASEVQLLGDVWVEDFDEFSQKGPYELLEQLIVLHFVPPRV